MLPVELSRSQHATQLEVVLRIDADLFWFHGHFPQQPILPGVAQLDWVMHYGIGCLAAGKQFSAVENIKFQQPVLPGSLLKLKLEWHEAKNQLSFRYLRVLNGEESVTSSGKIRLC